MQGMADDVSLEVAGLPLERRYFEELRQACASSGLGGRVRFLGHLDRHALATAYARADLFVWPSYAETFGHPLLEAHAHGLPIAASWLSVNREILGEAASFFDPFDISEMRSCLERVLAGASSTGALPRTYTWDACAEQTIDVLTEAAAS